MKLSGTFVMAAVVATVGACGTDAPEDATPDAPDGRVEDVSSEPEGGDATDEEEGDSPSPVGGPMTLVARAIDVSTDRLCDHDGDGLADNAVANLGSPGGQLFAVGLSALVMVGVEEGENRTTFHFPWIDDLSVPEDATARATVFDGRDTDDPEDPSDDFAGEEPFAVPEDDIAVCGEPRTTYGSGSLVAGQLDGDAMAEPMFFGYYLPGRGNRLMGTIEPFGTEGEISWCLYGLIGELGATGEIGGATSMLSLVLAGGTPFGAPHVPGLTPDVDVDGDGLERFETDENGTILSCIDGDSTVIEGADCWADERMADGISLVIDFSLVGARFAGLVEGWEERARGSCNGTFHCRAACHGLCECDPACDSARAAFETVDACVAELCPEECDPGSSFLGCAACREARCPEEHAACLAADCCDSPPDPSFWDPW